jgi:hypothetical protein
MKMKGNDTITTNKEANILTVLARRKKNPCLAYVSLSLLRKYYATYGHIKKRLVYNFIG